MGRHYYTDDKDGYIKVPGDGTIEIFGPMEWTDGLQLDEPFEGVPYLCLAWDQWDALKRLVEGFKVKEAGE